MSCFPGPTVKCPQCRHKFEYDKIEEQKREIKERFEQFEKFEQRPIAIPYNASKIVLDKMKKESGSQYGMQYATKEDMNKLLIEIEILRSDLVTLQEQIKVRRCYVCKRVVEEFDDYHVEYDKLHGDKIYHMECYLKSEKKKIK